MTCGPMAPKGIGAGIRDMTVGLFVLIGLQAFSFVIAGLHPLYNANALPNFQQFCKIDVPSRYSPLFERHRS